MRHALKTWPEHFQHLVDQKKTFEIRKHDRPFEIGDRLILQEFDPKNGKDPGLYTGAELEYKILHILSDHPGLKKNYSILSIARDDSGSY